MKKEVQTELQRAAVLAGQQYVDNMREKMKGIALERMARERESKDAVIEEEECPVCGVVLFFSSLGLCGQFQICYDALSGTVITKCGHSFCAECIGTYDIRLYSLPPNPPTDNVLKHPAVVDVNEVRYAMSERPCPSCRAPISKEMLFQRSAFEPTDAELGTAGPSGSGGADATDEDEDDGMPIDATVLNPIKVDSDSDSEPEYKPARKSKEKARRRFSKRADSDEDDDDDMSDFIVESDEDEEEKDARRELKKKLAKTKRIVLDSDDDMDEDGNEVELLPPKVVRKKRGERTERFLPSTKMKEMMDLLKEWAEHEATKNEKVRFVRV